MNRVRKMLAVTVSGGLLLTGVLSGVTTTAGTSAAATAPAGSATITKQLERVFGAGEDAEVVDSRAVTVSVSQTTELRGRERVQVSWIGARPSGARAADPYGENGLSQEYPVVVLQCRGVDDAAAPDAEQLTPETCWTSTRQQRSLAVVERTAVWRHDLHASEEEREAKTGRTPFPTEECQDPANLSTRITPFRAANGKEFLSCTAETMAPEAAVGAAYPPSEVAAFTDANGRGSVNFEVRSDVENESLGCSATTDCAIVVIPIMGLSCVDDDRECRRAGRWLPGSSNFAKDGIDMAVSPQLWWSPSNWNNRFTFPVTFGLPADTCDIQDDRPPTGFYGSELLSQAALQWSPAYCLDEDRFKFQHNRMPDEAGFKIMETGQGPAALVSGQRESTGTDPVAYAPTAVTGFAVGYSIDRPDNAGEFTDLRLTPRLVAKLLTQSYVGSDLGRGHEGMGDNPLSINLDPEFRTLNPGLDTISREAAATVLSLSESSDVIETLTDWINTDPDARKFVAGEADPWGMVVNPSYKQVALPTREWPMLDDYVPASQQECLQQNPAPYFTQLAAPVSTFRKIAEALLDAWPNVQTKCERSTITDPWKLGRVDRQGVGTRFVLGIVTLGDLERYGLRAAALQTTPGKFVAPTQGSLAAGVKLGKQSDDLMPFAIAQKAVRKNGNAYPGTMVVYTAARTAGMKKTEAKKVAQFIRVSTSEGQKPGRGNGQLPAGYLPINNSGATKPLFRAAQQAATAVQDQTGAEPPAEEPDETEAEEEPTPDSSPIPDTTPAPDETSVPDEEGPAAEEPVETATAPAAATTATPSTESRLGRLVLPLLLALALLGGMLSTAGRVALAVRRRG